jgi:AraC family transcriptional regulator of adaptative response/methylated-DNA-[protein]-cysteine methyltransferase
VREAIGAYLTLAGPWGPMYVAATADGVVAAAWRTTEARFVRRLQARLGRAIVPAEAAEHHPAARRLADALPVLEALLRGEPADGAAIPVDLRDRPAWDRRVLEAVRGIAWGETASYGEVARWVGAPRAARAVGGAVGRNPITLLIPCHRVIAADGTLGGYGTDEWGGAEEALALKAALLLREGVTTRRRGG